MTSDIYRGPNAPQDKDVLWVKDGTIRVYTNKGWTEIGGNIGDLEEYLSETSTNPIQNSAVYRQYMTMDDILDIPVIFDSIYRSMPLTFKILTDGDIVWSATDIAAVKTIEYSKNGGEWTEITSTTAGVSIPVVEGDVVEFRGDNEGYAVQVGTSWKRSTFSSSTCEFDAEGNIMSMLSSTNFAALNTIEYNYCFMNMFAGTNIINTKNLYLSADTICEGAYVQLFQNCEKVKTSVRRLTPENFPYRAALSLYRGCTSLITSPIFTGSGTVGELGLCQAFQNCTSLTTASDLKFKNIGIEGFGSMFKSSGIVTSPEIFAESCEKKAFANMFFACKNLETATKIFRVTTVAEEGCNAMFALCLSLKNAPKILTEEVQLRGFKTMFACCISLVNPPEMNVTTVGNYALSEMFGGCEKLIEGPNLPAQVLAPYCYYGMFEVMSPQSAVNLTRYTYCDSLITPPELPAMTLAESCYRSMFMSCRNLKIAPELPATELAVGCYYGMFNGVTIDGVIQKGCAIKESPILPAKILVQRCYSNMFGECQNLNKITCYAEDLSATDCTTDWVSGVAPKGTFIQKSGTTWTTGVNGIPEGWKVEYVDYSKMPLTIEVIDAGTFTWPAGAYYGLKYSKNGENYLTIPNDGIEVNAGDKLSIKTDSDIISVRYGDYTSTMAIMNSGAKCKFNLYGNIASLLFTNYETETTLLYGSVAAAHGCFEKLFQNSGVVDASDFVIPFTNVGHYTYLYMFDNCKDLVSAPRELPATDFTNYMDGGCYEFMFRGCTSLVNVPSILPCTSLNMKQCYYGMFSGCTSLTTAPDLPAKVLTEYCYCNMFYGCTHLNHIKCLAEDKYATSCLDSWVSGVAAQGVFVKAEGISWGSGASAIPANWTVEEV